MRTVKPQIVSGTVIGVLSALAFAGLSSAAETKIETVGLSWSPSMATISPGETVTFKNGSASTPHGLSWTGGPSTPSCPGIPNTAAGGTSWEGTCTFSGSGTYSFVCTVHASMTGAITVSGGPQAPSVTTGTATVGGDTSATLAGTVNPHGESTEYFFKYGTSTLYGSTTSKKQAGEGTGSVSASAEISGLTPGTTYHYLLVAENNTGTGEGTDKTFKTNGPPTATTAAATGVLATEATLHGTVNPGGHATTYIFEYGKELSYGEKTSSKSAGTGTANVSASATLTGLAPETTYHFRIVAEGSTKVNGNDLTFKTGSKSEPPPEEEHRPPVEEPKPPPPEGVTPPDTKIALKPPAKTHDRTPTIKFSASVAGASFRCSVDSKPFKACRSPFTATSLKPGRHRIRVKAVAGGITDPTPASCSFKVIAARR
jgi:plastocyanin